MSLLAEMRALQPFADGPQKRIAYAGDTWIGHVLPLGTDMFDRYPLLSGIDPYGRTIFNSLQVPVVIAELSRRRAELAEDEDGRDFLAELLSLASDCEREHKALVFIGD